MRITEMFSDVKPGRFCDWLNEGGLKLKSVKNSLALLESFYTIVEPVIKRQCSML